MNLRKKEIAPQITEALEAETPEEVSELIDSLKRRLEIHTDSGLAEMLGVKKSFVADIRAGRRKLPIWAKLQILDKIGYLAARDSILAMTPKAFRKRITESDSARFKLDLSSLDDSMPPPPPEFAQIVAAAIEKHGADAVATVVKAELLAYKARQQK